MSQSEMCLPGWIFTGPIIEGLYLPLVKYEWKDAAY